MPRRAEPRPPDILDEAGSATPPDADVAHDDEAPAPAEPDFAALPVVGLTRRRVGLLAGAGLAAWIVIVFARQVGDAAAASSRAEQMAADNVALAAHVSALEGELVLIQRQEYILQQARAYGLGGAHEVAFSVSPAAPPLGADAPGSAALRLGGVASRPTPLERWLSLLFGPGR
ncbi:MAG: hypothetical protein ACJ761_07780 [Chloroflexota bacterium]